MNSRPLRPSELELLELALGTLPNDRCRDDLLAQLAHLEVIEVLPALLEFSHDRASAPGCYEGRRNPIQGTVRDGDGHVTGGILVWIRDGLIRSLEAYGYEVEPSSLPSAADVSVDPPRAKD